MSRLGSRDGEFGAERRGYVSQSREPDPHLRVQRESALAVGRDVPPRFDHWYDAADLPSHAETIREPGDAGSLLPGADHLALHHRGARGRQTEREEWLDLPWGLPPEGRCRFDADAGQRPALETVPQVVLERARDPVEGVRLSVEHGARGGLHLEPSTDPALVDQLLAPRA